MNDETPEIEPAEEQPKRRRRRKAGGSEAASSADATVTKAEGQSKAEGPRVASEEDAAPSPAEPEAPQEPEAAQAAKVPARRRARRGGQPAEPASAPRRSRRQPQRRDVVVRAQAKYVRTSARKARLVCDHIRGKTVEEARAILTHAPRAVARDWSKVLESAVANAEHNHELIAEDLFIKAVHADEGPTIKRYRPRALGRATRIRKRTSHLTILLTSKK
jgi:ribosomal protein L22